MKRLLPSLILLATLPTCGKAQIVYDTYGGVISNNGAPAPACVDNVEWTIQLLNTTPKYQAFCTPTNGNASGHSHPYHYRGVQYIHTVTSGTNSQHGLTQTNSQYVSAKYGATDENNLYYARIKGWGFNAGGPGAFRTAVNSQVLAANKVPFMEFGSGGAQGLQNGFQHCINGADGIRQCKNLWNLGTGAYFSGTNRNVVDAYDPTFQAYENNEYANDTTLASFKTSPYFIGPIHFDQDNLSGYNGAHPTAAAAACPATYPCHPWDTDPAGSGWDSPLIANKGNIALSAPHQVNNPRNAITPNSCFADQKNYTKAAFAAFLKTRYGTVAALNSAWGAGVGGGRAYATGGANNTDGFGTDGVQVVGAITSGSGTGPYTATLTGTVDKFSVEVDVSGSCIGGDSQGDGNLRGGTMTSATVNYSTGAVSITFSGTPAAAPTITYWHGGWPDVGHGVLDEGGANIGNCDNTGVPGATGAQITEQVIACEEFLAQYTKQFLTVIKTAYNLVFTNASLPTKLFVAGGPFGSYRDLPRCGILKGAGQVADVISVAMGVTQAEMNFITQCSGDRAFIITQWTSAEADSDWYDCPSGAGCNSQPAPWPPTYDYATQSARGTAYQSDQASNWSQGNQSNGKHSWVGNMFWALHGETYGLVWNLALLSWRDNAFDGVENVTGSVTCSVPTQGFTCGGESASEAAHGNFLGPVTTANQQIDANLAALGNTSVAPSGSGGYPSPIIITQACPNEDDLIDYINRGCVGSDTTLIIGTDPSARPEVRWQNQIYWLMEPCPVCR